MLKEFPLHASAWANSLSKPPTNNQIVDMHNIYLAHKCTNLGQFLAIYLKRDVELTLASCVRWLAQLYGEFEIHSVDSNNLSIASYSFNGMMRQLARDQRPACYSNESLPAYSVIADTKIGGLTQVWKHEATNKTLPEGYSDIYPEGEDVGSLLYLDIHSLYGSSAEY